MGLSNTETRRLLFRRSNEDRFTQDSPVLPDVWAEFARAPSERHDLLLTPFQPRGQTSLSPARLAAALRERLKNDEDPALPKGGHRIAVNQTNVAVWLSFRELIRTVLPMSFWWWTRLNGVVAPIKTLKQKAGVIAKLLAADRPELPPGITEDLLWMVRVAGTIALQLPPPATKKRSKRAAKTVATEPTIPPQMPGEGSPAYFERLVQALIAQYEGHDEWTDPTPLIHLVSNNRIASNSLFSSVRTIKADAARAVFDVDCSKITWAIVDSGIDARHPAFIDRAKIKEPLTKAGLKRRKWAENTRVTATYDFTIIRDILSTDDLDDGLPDSPEVKKLKARFRKFPEQRTRIQTRLAEGLDVDWSLLLPLIEVPHDDNYEAPRHEHGTHVAGILGADWYPSEDPNDQLTQRMVGVCPNINLIDVRILDDFGNGDEFSVMAALQYLRYLNSHKDYMVVHGANVSLSIRHEVRNFACGRTPVCDECERLVGAGLVVVAAAGNRGFIGTNHDMEAEDSGFRTVTITDPGNADGVITVGSTHREQPHTYGVSYFSSRGPTGDGRIKPDLVAPGEKIDSTGPNFGLLRKDGTSMAAPHVSGAAALLMARHSEFIRQPRRIKEVLCRTATDLGRERYFQGAGMLDTLRALQSV